jgi:hypothetical protein
MKIQIELDWVYHPSLKYDAFSRELLHDELQLAVADVFHLIDQDELTKTGSGITVQIRHETKPPNHKVLPNESASVCHR